MVRVGVRVGVRVMIMILIIIDNLSFLLKYYHVNIDQLYYKFSIQRSFSVSMYVRNYNNLVMAIIINLV